MDWICLFDTSNISHSRLFDTSNTSHSPEDEDAISEVGNGVVVEVVPVSNIQICLVPKILLPCLNEMYKDYMEMSKDMKISLQENTLDRNGWLRSIVIPWLANSAGKKDL